MITIAFLVLSLVQIIFGAIPHYISNEDIVKKNTALTIEVKINANACASPLGIKLEEYDIVPEPFTANYSCFIKCMLDKRQLFNNETGIDLRTLVKKHEADLPETKREKSRFILFEIIYNFFHRGVELDVEKCNKIAKGEARNVCDFSEISFNCVMNHLKIKNPELLLLQMYA